MKDNLTATGFADQAVAIQQDAFIYLRTAPDSPFDYVFVAPPQYHGLWRKAVQALDLWEAGLSEDAWVIVQIDPREAEEEGLARLARFDERVYGQTMLRFYRASG